MNSPLIKPLVAVAALLLLFSLSVFSVDETEFAVRTRFGQIQDGGYAPGLHWCWPFEQIERVDRRVRSQRIEGESFLGTEQQALLVDVGLIWRVRDANVFLRTRAGDEQAVTSDLGDALRSELKAFYARQPLTQVLAAPLGGLSPASMTRLKFVAAGLGVELLDARVKRIDPSDEGASAIYVRMQAAYTAQTRQVRTETVADGERLRAEGERDRAEILAVANRDAQRLRGEGDAKAAAIYARSYGANPEFAAFYRTLQAYRAALGREGDILVIEPEGEFFKYLHGPARR